MSCHGCAAKFGMFNKENGCPNCGFSYCNKCLKYKAVVPKLGSSVQKVCRTCQMKLSQGDKYSPEGESSPPASFLRRLESLENPSKPPITMYRQDSRIQKLKEGMKEADREIVNRLEKLREGRKQQQQPVPSEDEVAKRLALLKGEDPTRVSAPNTIVPDTRSNQEKADSLLQQYTEEKELDSKRANPGDEIAQRLAKLRGQDTSSVPVENVEEKIMNVEGRTVTNTEESPKEQSHNVNALLSQLQKEMKDSAQQMKDLKGDIDSCLKHAQQKLQRQKQNEEKDEGSSDEEVEKTIKKALDEVALEEELDEESEASVKEEELPWCIICNENATVRCIDCDNDLYCKSCFTQGHDEWDMKHHKHVPYTPKEQP